MGPLSLVLILGSQDKEGKDKSEEELGKQTWIGEWDRPILPGVSPSAACTVLVTKA